MVDLGLLADISSALEEEPDPEAAQGPTREEILHGLEVEGITVKELTIQRKDDKSKVHIVVDFESLDAVEREVRAGEALEDLFSFRVAGTERARDRWVSRAERGGIEYASNGVTSILRWTDVDSVDGQSAFDVPGRPVTLYLYLADESPSLETVRDKVVPTLASNPRTFVLASWGRPAQARRKARRYGAYGNL